MYSIENLSDAPRQLRDMSDEELKLLFVAGSKVLFVCRSKGVTVLSSLNGVVTLPNHTTESSVPGAINSAIAGRNKARLAAKDKATAENSRRREVMGTRV
jgi:hypothetical protein